MNHASLFSGIGGFDLAAEWAGWTNVFNCEIDPFCQQVLKYHFPNATQYTDIRKTDFSVWRGRVDVLTGGFPCQPFSLAGKRKGTEDERHLWPEMLRAIRDIRPAWVVGENVFGIVNWSEGLVFEQVCSDLESLGYEVQPFIIPAAGIGAPHKRDRVWFIAYRNGNSGNTRRPEPEGQFRQTGFANGCGNNAKDSERVRCYSGKPQEESGIWRFREPCSRDNERICREEGAITNAKCERCDTRSCTNSKRKDTPEVRRNFQSTTDRLSSSGDATNTYGSGWRTETDGAGKPRFINETGKGNHWQNFPTQSPVCGRNDGLSMRLDCITFPKWRQESIKAYGNAVVPLVPFQIFQTINEYEVL